MQREREEGAAVRAEILLELEDRALALADLLLSASVSTHGSNRSATTNYDQKSTYRL